MENKVCVYAICKNEVNNVAAWMESVKDADSICVVDTGSTDGTLAELEKFASPRLQIRQYIQEDFHFANARNAALALARSTTSETDNWIFVCLDFDEFLESDGINKIKSNWQNGFDTMRLTGITEGEGAQDVDHKIHSSNPAWYWHRRVHEIITLPGKRQKDWVVGGLEPINYIHKQDKTKVRDYYGLLQKAFKDNPDDIKTTIYLGWESYNHGEFDEFYELNKHCINLINTNQKDEFYHDPEYIIQCYFNCALYHSLKGEYAVSAMYFERMGEVFASGAFPCLRRYYVEKAAVMWELQQKAIAINLLMACLKITTMPYCWVEDANYYNDGFIWQRIGYYYLNFSQPLEALVAIERAIGFSGETDELLELKAIAQEQALSYQFKEATNKICVYAICKNEKQFVDKWLESMSEADYIVVLDTGSTDGTYEMLRDDPRVYRAEQKVITPWRFDTARNESMRLIPDDANILLCTDLDELLEPGWAKIVKDNWIPNYHNRGLYKYAWSHSEEGAPGRVFCYDKLHDKNWYWTAPVHELLHSEIYDQESKRVHNGSHILDLFESGMYLHHYPDPEKSRASYLPLLELRAKENPRDYYGLYYLSHEYHYRGFYDKSNQVLTYINEKFQDRFNTIENAAVFLFKGDNYRALEDPYRAIANYNEAIKIDSTYREPYLNAAEVFNELGMHEIAIGYVRQALTHSWRHYVWIERDTSWREQPDDILSVAYSRLGQHETAYQHALLAYESNPSDERIATNLEIIKAQMNS